MTKIAINFFEIHLSKIHVNIPYLNYESREELQKIRQDSPNSIFVHSKDKIYFWNSDSFPKENFENISLTNNFNLLRKIVVESLLSSFYKNKTNYKIKKTLYTYRITLLDQDIAGGKYKGLKLFKSFQLHFTSLPINGQNRFGLTVSTSIKVKVIWKKQDFLDNKISIADLKFDENTDEVFSNLKAINKLAKHFNYASELKIEKDKFNAIQNELKEINDFIKIYFEDERDSFSLPDNLELKYFGKTFFDFNDYSQKNFPNEILTKPECYFYNGNYPKKENSFNNRQKIGYNKPFSFDNFENKTINIAIIYLKRNYTNVANFFKYVQEELIATFKLKKENFKYEKFEIEGDDLKNYQEQLQLIKDCKLVIVVVDENQETLVSNESPYYFCKAEFMKRGINTQEVQIQQIQKFLSDKQQNIANYTDHNIALNIYAKLGGIAWTIKPYEPKNELVIGIGATTNKEGQPILGLTSIFRGNGKYLFGKVSAITEMKNYVLNLEKVLTSTIDDYIKDGSLNKSEKFILIFHVFKSIGENSEIKALNKILKKFSEYSFEYAFVHIGEGHNYRFFTYDYTNQEPHFEVKRGFGQNKRGTFIKLNNNLGFLGLRVSSSIPLRIEIDKNSNFVDLEYIIRQIYQFAEMSHTSYNKSGKPVTIKYPQLMARFAEKFKEGNLMYNNNDEISIPDNSLWFI